MNLVYLNGAIVPAEAARVSIFDRGFLYGDGVFETVRVQAARLICWTEHLARLERSLSMTGIALPEPVSNLTVRARELIDTNQCTDAVLRITISRGPGARGYSPRGAGPATVAMSLHPRMAPPAAGIRVIVASLRLLADDQLGTVKTANKLRQVLARAEAEAAGADDALLVNQDGGLAEATGSNLFWIEGSRLITPPTRSGLLPGVARGLLLKTASAVGLEPVEAEGTIQSLHRADGVFLANVVSGPIEVTGVNGLELPRSSWFQKLRLGFEAAIEAAV